MDEVFGRYRLRGLLGAGGMGQVYRAYDTELDRDVAIKVLPAQASTDPTFEQRFRREARTAAGLGEPHIVPIHDSGEIDGRLFIAMQLVDGTDLATLLAQHGPMSAERAVRIVEQAAEALDAAHHAGLVHRDVKPANLLITPRNFVYLIDFGIARAPGETKLTNTGSTIGTMAYMSPERFTAGQVDKRADIYALACVLYECLTGAKPFPDATIEQQMYAHIHAPRPQPSAAGVVRGFDDVVATGMSVDPLKRFLTAGALAAAARHALNGQTSTPPVPLPALTFGQTAMAPTVAAPVNAPAASADATALAPPRPVAPSGKAGTRPNPVSAFSDWLGLGRRPSHNSQKPPVGYRLRPSRLALVAVVFFLAVAVTAAGIVHWAKSPNSKAPTVTATIPVDSNPSSVTVDPFTHTVYAVNPPGATVFVIDASTNTVTTSIGVGAWPGGVAVDPTAHAAYVTNPDDNTVSAIDTTTNTVVATIRVGEHPRYVAVDPGTHTAYVANLQDNYVSTIDTATNALGAPIPVSVGQGPGAIAVDTGTHAVYNINAEGLSVIDTATNTVTTTITVGKTPSAVAVDPATHVAYVIDETGDTMSVVDIAANTVTRVVPVGKGPSDVAVDATTHTAYVTNFDDDTVSVIDTETNTVTSTIAVGKGPMGVAVDVRTHAVFVTNSNDNTVSVITQP